MDHGSMFVCSENNQMQMQMRTQGKWTSEKNQTKLGELTSFHAGGLEGGSQ
jgi:hypothetical protein